MGVSINTKPKAPEFKLIATATYDGVKTNKQLLAQLKPYYDALTFEQKLTSVLVRGGTVAFQNVRPTQGMFSSVSYAQTNTSMISIQASLDLTTYYELRNNVSNDYSNTVADLDISLYAWV